ncbi:LLM class flavin-dependent oxidoreductase [Dactylosporangium sp. NPDC051541]|uniref:LLM class flavin-dependent oxidoreductase n=1 Tax=Dactylosporangium sp. NPDC051541 TaxID=3363977 RepID=UPI00379AD346
MPDGARSAIWVPLFDPLADPLAVTRLAAQAEEAGWDGFFVWDHVRWQSPIRQVADPWVVLSAIAVGTASLRIGTMVTPLPRRRPAKVARETATLDRLSGGRLTLGVGIGGDRSGEELSRLGDETDDRRRGAMLDEALSILEGAWSGAPVRHRGEHYTVDDVEFLPRPVQEPGVPVWVAAFPGYTRPLRRAARYQGFFPVNLESPDALAAAVAKVTALRADPSAPYDVAAELPPGDDPAPYVRAGATWLLTAFDPATLSLDHVRGVIRDGPS